MVHMYFSCEQTLAKNIPCTFLLISAQWRMTAACGFSLFNQGLFVGCFGDSNADAKCLTHTILKQGLTMHPYNCADTNSVDHDVLHLPETCLPLPTECWDQRPEPPSFY